MAATRERKAPRTAAPAPVAWSEQERTLLALLGWDAVAFRQCHQFVRKPAPGTVQRDAGVRETPDSVFHRAIFAALKDANGTLPAPTVCRLIAALDNRLGRGMKRQPKPEVICCILQQVYGREAYFHRGILTVPSLFKL